MSSASHDGHGSSLLSDILAIIGLVILGVIIIWGIVHLVSLSTGWFRSLFPESTPTVQITAPKQVASGTATPISWKYNSTEAGTYAFLYQCQSGFRFDFTPTPDTTMPIPCGAAFTAPTPDNTITVTPVLSSTMSKNVSVPFSVVFIPAATSSKQVVGTAMIVVTPGTSTPASNTASVSSQTATTHTSSASTKTYSASGSSAQRSISYASGPADLAVRIMAVGVIDQATGQFVANTASSPNDISAVEFDIANTGSGASGTWYFEANLPTVGGYDYISPLQASLAPGDHIVNVLRFNPVAPGGGIFSVAIDPNNEVNDSNRANNYASISVAAPIYYTSQPMYYSAPTYQY